MNLKYTCTIIFFFWHLGKIVFIDAKVVSPLYRTCTSIHISILRKCGFVEELNDWQDPELQADIEGALGVDLGSKKKKGKGKGKGKKSKEPKYPNLTDINVVENTARTRLEKKVLNK